MLLSSIFDYNGTIDEYMNEIIGKHCYIEVQLWNDDYCECSSLDSVVRLEGGGDLA